MNRYDFFATCAKGLEPLVAGDLRDLGAADVKEVRAGVAFTATIREALAACLWSRLASRILLPLARFPAASPEELYQGGRAIAWDEHLAPDSTLAVTAHSSGSQITHSHYAALTVKDAVVDQFRDKYGRRPSVSLVRPDLVLNLYLHRDQAVVSIDLAGESLHRRGYRREGVAAPLKETLAAAILVRAGWPGIARTGGGLLDPMCGSGTLPIEAALMAGDIAPGLLRTYFGFFGWKGYQPRLWQELLQEAAVRQEQGRKQIPAIVGYDGDRQGIRAARENAARAGLGEQIHFEQRQLAAAGSFPGKGKERPGLVVINPPYGERLGEVEALRPLYREIGTWLKERFQNWQAALITANPDLGREMRLKAHRSHVLYNGALKCRLLRFTLDAKKYQRTREAPTAAPLSASAEMLANRLRKNMRSLKGWLRQQGIDAFRFYDRDLPEYNVTMERYNNLVQVREEAAPRDPAIAQLRRKEICAALVEVLGISLEEIFFVRALPGAVNAEPELPSLGGSGTMATVTESGCRFVVIGNESGIHGLNLELRFIRALIHRLARGRNFLHLFARAGTALVAAAKARAARTTIVAGPEARLDWIRKNLEENRITGPEHQLIEADTLAWLSDCKERYDLIYLEPPARSGSAKGKQGFDLQRDHVALLGEAAALLAPEGTLLFAARAPHFPLDQAGLAHLSLTDLGDKIVARDFARSSRQYSCWEIRK